MGFTAGSESVAYKLYTGLTDVQVVALNPTKEEAEKLGINMKNDPIYITTDETSGNKKIRIDIYVKSEATGRIDKMAFFMEDVAKTSSAGNTQYINNFGKSCYAASIAEATEKYQWFKGDGAREAVSGEVELVDFIVNLLNIEKDQVAKLDNPKLFFTGNLTEITSIFKKFNDRKAQVLYTVRENDGNWYQGIYTRYFSRAGNKTTKWWDKHFEGNTSKPNYQNSFMFQEFNPMAQGTSTEAKSTGDAEPSIWNS